jgi:hypothetical protein
MSIRTINGLEHIRKVGLFFETSEVQTHSPPSIYHALVDDSIKS